MEDRELFGLIAIVLVPLLLPAVAGLLWRLFRTPKRQRLERTRGMRAAAEQMGLRFYDTSDERIPAALPECALLEKGKARRVSNLMSDRRRPPGLLVFDYEYTRHGRQLESGYFEVLYLAAFVRFTGEHPLPYARIFRKDWFGGPLGERDVYALSDPQAPGFDRDHALSGRPAAPVRAMLTEPVREAIGSWTLKGPRPTVETLPDWVAVYVESDHAERHVAPRCVEVVRYASRLAAALRGPSRGQRA